MKKQQQIRIILMPYAHVHKHEGDVKGFCLHISQNIVHIQIS